MYIPKCILHKCIVQSCMLRIHLQKPMKNMLDAHVCSCRHIVLYLGSGSTGQTDSETGTQVSYHLASYIWKLHLAKCICKLHLHMFHLEDYPSMNLVFQGSSFSVGCWLSGRHGRFRVQSAAKACGQPGHNRGKACQLLGGANEGICIPRPLSHLAASGRLHHLEDGSFAVTGGNRWPLHPLL